jgi:hypothetical protein
MLVQLAVVMHTYVKHTMEQKAYHSGEAVGTSQQELQLHAVIGIAPLCTWPSLMSYHNMSSIREASALS